MCEIFLSLMLPFLSTSSLRRSYFIVDLEWVLSLLKALKDLSLSDFFLVSIREFHNLILTEWLPFL